MIMNNITIVVLWGFIQHINLSIQKYHNYKQRSTNLLSIVHDVVCRLLSISFHWISASPTSQWPINILQIYYKITICIILQFIILFMNSLKLSWSWILFSYCRSGKICCAKHSQFQPHWSFHRNTFALPWSEVLIV